MKYKFKLHQVVKTNKTLDFSSTNGPIIPVGTEGRVNKRCRGTDLIWVDFDKFSKFGKRLEQDKFFDLIPTEWDND